MKILHKQISLFTEEQLTASAADFPANHTASQENGSAKRMNATCGHKCYEQYARFNQATSWGKMFMASLIGQEGWYSTRCKLTWKMKGTKSSRLYFQLQAETLRTKDIESFSAHTMLPTPTTQEPTTECELTDSGRRMTADGASSHSLNIGRMAIMGMLPTPVASDTEGGISDPQQISQKNNRFIRTSATTGTEFGAKLRDVAQMLPTPTARDQKTGCKITDPTTARRIKENIMFQLNDLATMGMLPTPMADDSPEKNTGKRKQDGLQKMAYLDTGQTSRLNPLFVAEMMGFPPDWTVLPFQNGQTNQ